jgi:hypothetical protein
MIALTSNSTKPLFQFGPTLVLRTRAKKILYINTDGIGLYQIKVDFKYINMGYFKIVRQHLTHYLFIFTDYYLRTNKIRFDFCNVY